MPNKKGKKPLDMQSLVAALTKATQPKSTPKRKKRSRRGGPSLGPVSDGEVTIARSELIGTATLSANSSSASGYIFLSPSEFSFLKGVGASFSRSKWITARAYYKPAVGTTYGGLVSMGFCLDPDKSISINRNAVVAMTPSATTAAWQDTEGKPLVLNKNQLATRAWYFHNDTTLSKADRCPAAFYWAVDASETKGVKVTVGEFWIHYKIVMQGTVST